MTTASYDAEPFVFDLSIYPSRSERPKQRSAWSLLAPRFGSSRTPHRRVADGKRTPA